MILTDAVGRNIGRGWHDCCVKSSLENNSESSRLVSLLHVSIERISVTSPDWADVVIDAVLHQSS